MKIYEKISNRDVSYIEYCLLYKMIEIIGEDNLIYDKKSGYYISSHYLITVTKKRAFAKPVYDDYYTFSIKPPKNLTSI